jgi:formyltetrahydrofolate-dependent phosphoribosylglycinamide formyltransferase
MAERVRVGILISGRGSNMVALAEWKRRSDRAYDIALVASNNPEARGLLGARIMGIDIWAQSHKGMDRAAFDRLLDAELRARGVEVIALAGYMRLLSPEFIALWEGRILNVHPSLLPAYKGLNTHARMMEAGETYSGCTVHVVTEELDDGPILAQAKVRIRERDTAETLAARVLAEEHRIYPEALDTFCRALRGRNQPTISSGLKKSSISIFAFSRLSEPWTLFASMDSASSLRIVPGSAFSGLVAPITSRFFATASSPSRTCTTTGPEIMNWTRSLKKGRSRWTA